MPLQGPRRKLVHACLYEAIAIGIVTLAVRWVRPDADTTEAGSLAVLTSAIALLWNMAFNTLFEAWERRQAQRMPAQAHSRTVRRRIAHAIGFEGGLAALTVPLIAWWLHMGWWEAVLADLGLLVFFLGYTFVFNWVFDHLFGLPDLARTPNP